MNHIKMLLDQIDLVRDDMALGIMSDPGMSKTSQVKQWAEEHGRKYVEIIISQRMPSEISGMPMPINDSKTMEIFDYNTLLQLEDGDVLAFDEFTNGNIMTLNACLTLIQERTMISGKKLPSVVIVAMGNPQGKCDLLPQTKQRFIWYEAKPDTQMWCRYIEDKYRIDVRATSLVSSIMDQYKAGFAYDKYNYMTFRSAENIIKLVKNMYDSGLSKDQIKYHPIFDGFDQPKNLMELYDKFYYRDENDRFLKDKAMLIDRLGEYGFSTEARSRATLKDSVDTWISPILIKKHEGQELTADEKEILRILGLE